MLAGCSKPTIAPEAPETPVAVEKPVPGVISEALIQEAEKKYGPFAGNRYRAFNAKLRELQESPDGLKLEAINDFFNQVPYGEDLDVWGQSDYWATPMEFLGKDRGDCEDYVIAKYFALRDLGIGSEKLYFAYVKSLRLNREHMVLSYFETPTSIPLILDNSNYKIFPADRRKDLVPVYNFNMRVIFRAGESGQNGQRMRYDRKIHNQWEQLLRDVDKKKL